MISCYLSRYLDSVDELAINVQCGHAVLQHSFAHDQHQVVPLALSNQLAAAETSAAGQDLIEGGFFTRLIGCLMGGGKEKQAAILMSQRALAEVKTLIQGG